MTDILVLGIGNVLMGDEGIGVHVAKYLDKSNSLPANVTVVDGGTGGFHLLEYFQNYPRVILIDATLDGRSPGTVNILKPKFSSDYPTTLTAHDIGLKDLLDALYLMEKQPEITLFTVSIMKPEKVTLELNPEIEQSIEKTAKIILDYINGLEE